FSRDWSSDVCSSDLTRESVGKRGPWLAYHHPVDNDAPARIEITGLQAAELGLSARRGARTNERGHACGHEHGHAYIRSPRAYARSEERRVGKEGRSR